MSLKYVAENILSLSYLLRSSVAYEVATYFYELEAVGLMASPNAD